METTLPFDEWRRREREYQNQVLPYTEPFRARRRIGESHPVHDFLFVYYQYSPAKLERWHPGIEIRLDRGDEYPESFPPSEYATGDHFVVCDATLISAKTRTRLEWILNLLAATQNRRPNFSCLGLHEWAMVYRGKEVRHEKTTRLRLPQSEIDQVVESRPLTCTHFDAFRFFATQAQPLNRTQPNLLDRPKQEQPACIHANMDLYKWAYKSMPWVGSELLLKCFLLAMQARAIDMRASPYDLSEFGDYEPIRIETPAGRAQYEQHQRDIASEATKLRAALVDRIKFVLESASATT